VDLFADQRKANLDRVEPLAVRMRPRTLEEFLGQQHFIGPGKLLRRMLEADRITSALFYGPPGTGKTTLATIIAAATKAHFEQVNAAAVGVKEIREILHAARQRLGTAGQRTILFVDELHRFNRAQQDVLLGDVESGVVILLGATTENPFFAVNSPLISRSQIFQFEALTEGDIKTLLFRAVADRERGLGEYHVTLHDDAAEHLATMSDGDARRALTALEVAVLSQSVFEKPFSEPRPSGSGPISWTKPLPDGRGSVCHDPSQTRSQTARGGTARADKPPVAPGAIVVDLQTAADSIQRKALQYDATGDTHYDSISAMIKSIRGSDPDAAVYWIARMIEAGEDPRFIARRIVIAAAEDIGNADPRGLVLAQAAADATQFIGLPECQIPLAQAAIYLACAPKSNASALAIWTACEDVRSGRTLPVPKHLRSTGYRGAEILGAGKGYQYPHNAPEGIVQQDYLGVDKTYYTPTDRGAEARMRDYLEKVRRGSAEPKEA